MPPPAAHFNSSARSRAVCHRSSGFLARQQTIAWSNTADVIGLTEPIGTGSSSRIAAATLKWLFPSKARFPVTISYRIVPREKMSLRPSTSFPCTCSGDMYWNVPRTMPFSVTGEFAAGLDPVTVKLAAADACGGKDFARPKSNSLTPVWVSIMLPGFRSRWTTPVR